MKSKQEKLLRPGIKCNTLDRLKKYGNYPPNTSLDWMINDVLDQLEGKKQSDTVMNV